MLHFVVNIIYMGCTYVLIASRHHEPNYHSLDGKSFLKVLFDNNDQGDPKNVC